MSITVTVRVVLHKDDARTEPHPSNAKEYDTLHAEMHARGFSRFYDAKGGFRVKLPPGEYIVARDEHDGKKARDAARDEAIDAATIATTAKRFSLLVTGGDSATSYRLERITEDPDA